MRYNSGMLTEGLLRAGRITRYLPWLRGLELVRRVYKVIIPRQNDWTLRVNDFDHDLKLDIDPRECVGITVWHKPEIFEKSERKIFCENIFPGDVVLDVGANIGVYSLLGAKRGGIVHAIEADPRNAQRLKNHVRLNGFESRIKVFEIAAMDHSGTLSIFRNPINCGGSNCFDGTDRVDITACTIDSLDLPPIDICKMDIEGAETRAILGMQKTIGRSPNLRLCIEYNPTLSMGDCSPLADVLHEIFGSVEVIGGRRLQPGERPTGFCDLYCTAVRREVDWESVREHALKIKGPKY